MSLGIIAAASAFVVRSNLRDSGKVKSWDIFSLAILQYKEVELRMSIVFFSNSRPFITIKVTQHRFYKQVFRLTGQKNAKS